MEMRLREVGVGSDGRGVPMRLVAAIELALERGKIRSSTPDVQPILARARDRAVRGTLPRYAELREADRMLSLQLILFLFFSTQHGTAASFAPVKWVGRYFVYYPTRDTWVVIEDLKELYEALDRIEVNGSRWKLTGTRLVRARNLTVVDFRVV
jgi:hypothetical protein